jgi:hypothetical protein
MDGCPTPSAEMVTPGNSNQKIQQKIVAISGSKPIGVKIWAMAGGMAIGSPARGCPGGRGAAGA